MDITNILVPAMVASFFNGFKPLFVYSQALKNGNSAFVGENWNAHPNQWEILLHQTEKLGIEDVEGYTKKWKRELAEASGILVGSERDHRSKALIFQDLIC